MLLPSEIKILNHVYKVIEVDEITDDVEGTVSDTDQVLGLLDDSALQILILKSLQPSRKYQVFLHEMTHALFNIIDFRRYLKDPEAEESVVNFLSDILLQVLTENSLKFPKQYKKMPLGDDNVMKSTIIANHTSGVPIKDICKTFHLKEADVKKVIKDTKGSKGKDTKKVKSKVPK